MSAQRTACAGRKATVLACVYVGLIAAATAARGTAGLHSDQTQAVLFFLSFPGSLLVTTFLVLPLGALTGNSGAETVNPYGPMLHLVGGAALNVLIACTAVNAFRHARTARRKKRHQVAHALATQAQPGPLTRVTPSKAGSEPFSS
ncbi:hypothetical protein [Streptomyces hydrogenans]|uniref:hypothetical protein n=1 Tax=Streptomyces hydrogenans TaxID=1873719 RepID=UPI003319B25D